MKLTHVKLVTSNFDPKRPSADAAYQGVTDFAEADGYELELRSDGLVSVRHGNELAMYPLGQVRHMRAASLPGVLGRSIALGPDAPPIQDTKERMAELIAALPRPVVDEPSLRMMPLTPEHPPDVRYFEPALSGGACGRCGAEWLGDEGVHCTCPPAEPTAVITAVDREAGVITYSGITPTPEPRKGKKGKRRG